MSSWKKASKVNQKTYRERHQPESRAHLGFLEKKKDYVVRARDYSYKQRVLKSLKKHARDRNPDEFYYHMINSQLKDGKHVEKKKPDSEETVQQKLLMENRSINYVNMKRTIENKKISRIQSGLHLTDLVKSVKSNHLHFDSDGEEIAKTEENVSNDQHSLEQISKMPLHHINEASVRRINKLKENQYKKLSRRIDRHKQLAIIQQKMEMNQALKKPCYEKPKLVKAGNKSEAAVYKWKYERKR